MIEMLIVISGIFFGLQAALLVYFGRFWFMHRSKEKELDELLSLVLKSAKEAEEVIQGFQDIDSEEGEYKRGMPNLQSDKYLSTLITVLIKKFNGEVVLTSHDFKNVSFDDYVTLFVDTSNSDIILRSTGEIGDLSDISSYMVHPPSDEDTFH
jgi:hypothetical protein